MNERIRELAEQNGFIHEWMTTGEQNDKLKSLERFAELVDGLVRILSLGFLHTRLTLIVSSWQVRRAFQNHRTSQKVR